MLGLRYLISVGLGAALILTPKLSFASQNPKLVDESITSLALGELDTDAAERLNFLPSLETSKVIWVTLSDFQFDQREKSTVIYTEPITETPTALITQLPTFETEPTPVMPRDTPSVITTSPGNPLYFPTQPQQVDAGPVEAITLQQALEIARNNNQDFQIAQFNLEVAEASLQEALAAWSPNVGTTADINRDTSGPTTGTFLNAALEANYNLYSGGRRSALVDIAREGLQINLLDLERVAEQLRLDVASAYYNLQEADALVEVAQSAVIEAQQSLQDARLLEQAGLGTRFDVLRAEVQLANSTQDLEQTLADQLIRRQALVETLGARGKRTFVAADAIERAGEWELELPESIIQAYRNRAELRQQLSQREINRNQIQVALAQTRPQVDLFSRYRLSGGLGNNVTTDDGFSVGARMQWTFFDGGATRARAEQEQTNVEISETRFDDARGQIRLEVEQAYYTLQANDQNINTAGIAVELAEESLRLARLRFQAGVGTQTDVIAAQSALTTARGNLVRAVINYNRSFAALKRAVSNTPGNVLFDQSY